LSDLHIAPATYGTHESMATFQNKVSEKICLQEPDKSSTK